MLTNTAVFDPETVSLLSAVLDQAIARHAHRWPQPRAQNLARVKAPQRGIGWEKAPMSPINGATQAPRNSTRVDHRSSRNCAHHLLWDKRRMAD